MIPTFQLKLPTGTSSFERLRAEKQVYVDKTALIFDLLENGQKYFLTRPRRFGKSLLLSTFDSLFRRGLQDFGGLALEKLWKDEAPKTVVNLDFSLLKGFRNFEEFLTAFDDFLADSLYCGKFITGRPSRGMGRRVFSEWLLGQPVSSVVILIDEYDAPLTECLTNPALFDDVRTVLSSFYALLKSADRAVRFLFITGITKFTRASIFSGLNSLSDISLAPRYGTLLGYTEEELRLYFPDRLEAAAQILKTNVPDLLKSMRRHYDGFCFEKSAMTHVFAPWSVLNFLAHPEDGFGNYWLDSSGRPSALTGYFRSHALRSPASLASEKCVSLTDLASASSLEDLNDLVLLAQAGYLTIKGVEEDTVFLGYPNAEVKSSMAKLYASELLSGKTFVSVGAGGLARKLASETPEEIVRLFNRLLAATDSRFFEGVTEYGIQAIFFAYLSGAGLEPQPERHGSRGRSDLEVRAGGRAWVFEFKMQRQGESAEGKLKDAIAQIEEKGYGEQADPRETELIRIGLVFSEEKRRIALWGLARAPE